MIKIVFATHNAKKLSELQSLLPDNYRVVSATELNIPEPEETELTLQGNSKLKADFVFDFAQNPTIADDTGLEVEALNGRPGVFSARYAGEPKNDQNNVAKLLQELANQPNRKAQFRTIITYKDATQTLQFEGIVKGTIALNPSGTEGFGYDPVFLPEASTRTFAEMNLSEKNTFSHRARAMQKLLEFLGRE